MGLGSATTGLSPHAAEPRARRAPRRSLVVLAGDVDRDDRRVRPLTRLLDELGIERVHLDGQTTPRGIAEAVRREHADAVELCLPIRGCGVPFLRDLLRELIAMDRRDVSIVIHRV